MILRVDISWRKRVRGWPPLNWLPPAISEAAESGFAQDRVALDMSRVSKKGG